MNGITGIHTEQTIFTESEWYNIQRNAITCIKKKIRKENASFVLLVFEWKYLWNRTNKKHQMEIEIEISEQNVIFCYLWLKQKITEMNKKTALLQVKCTFYSTYLQILNYSSFFRGQDLWMKIEITFWKIDIARSHIHTELIGVSFCRKWLRRMYIFVRVYVVFFYYYLPNEYLTKILA